MSVLKNRQNRTDEDVCSELEGKVIQAAQTLREQLADSAGQPSENADQAVLDGASSSAAEEPKVLVMLRERQRKRKAEEETQEQGRVAKAKAATRQKKRTACTSSGIFETPVSKRKASCLSPDMFAANAKDPSEREHRDAASSSWTYYAQQRCSRLWKL